MDLYLKELNDCNDCLIEIGLQFGGIAQLGERLLCKQEVIGSIPITSTIDDGGEEGTRQRVKVQLLICNIVYRKRIFKFNV